MIVFQSILAAAIAMIRKKKRSQPNKNKLHTTGHNRFLVGIVTGFLGAGGGF
jgi:uncharacterized membrane protein YfcA